MEQALILTFLGMGVVAAVLGVNYLAILAVSLFNPENRSKKTASGDVNVVIESEVLDSTEEITNDADAVLSKEAATVAVEQASVVAEETPELSPKITLAIMAAIDQYESENGIA